MKYNLVSFEDRTTEHYLKGKPYTFINIFPFKIYITVNKKLILSLESRQERSKNLNFGKGFTIHILYNYNGKFYEIARPVFLSPTTRTIRIGDVVYNNLDMSYYNSHADISGIRFHNRITFPIEIWNKGRKIGQVKPDDGTGYMSGSPNSVYLNNDGNGFRLGEEITFYLPHIKQVWTSSILNDNYVSDIYVGVINQKFTPPNPDTYAYRIDAPDNTGYTFYEPVTAYISQKTNKNSIL
jgi:hypothetical protein